MLREELLDAIKERLVKRENLLKELELLKSYKESLEHKYSLVPSDDEPVHTEILLHRQLSEVKRKIKELEKEIKSMNYLE